MSCERNNLFLQQAAGLIPSEIIKKNNIEDPVWTKTVKKVPYDQSKGLTNTYTVAQRPDYTNEPTFTPLALSDGTNSMCEPPTTTVQFSGFETRTFFLEQARQRSMDICLEDIAFSANGKAEVETIVDNMTAYSAYVMRRYVQNRYVALAGNKVVATLLTAAGATPNQVRSDDTVTTYPNVAPSAKLTQGILDAEAYLLGFRGGASGAYAMQGGSPIYNTLMSAEASDMLVLGNSSIREDIRKDPARVEELTGPLGVSRRLRSNAHTIIQFPRRFNLVGGVITEVRPWATTPVVAGKRNRVEVSAAYLNAPFEEVIIWLDNAYQLVVPGSMQMPRGLKYEPQNYTGEFQFINIRGYVCIINSVATPTNLDGNTGFFLGRWRFGSRAPRPELMTSILFQRCGYGNDTVACTYMAGGSSY